MRTFILLFCITCINPVFGQKIIVNDVLPDSNYANVCSKKLYSDSLSTAFLIWVKQDVALHLHEAHTEQIYVLAGTGEMQLGEIFFEIKAGDYISIPTGTPHQVKVTSAVPLQVISIQAPLFDGSDRIFIDD